jgi:spoIIIJ-associated protein
MEAVVRTARTVEEAEELALKELGADRNEVEVEILSKGKAGFLGIGAELAQVRVTRLSAQVGDTDSAQVGDTDSTQVGDTSAAGLAVEVVNNILGPAKVNVVSTLRAAHDPEVGGPIIDLTGEDSGLLIGRRGQTLTALQFLANLIVRQELGEDVRVVLDVEHYRQRREASLRDMAAKVGSRVHQTGRSITLEPMSAADRRIIHVSLADHPGVSTESVGFGDDRKVTVNPKRE